MEQTYSINSSGPYASQEYSYNLPVFSSASSSPGLNDASDEAFTTSLGRLFDSVNGPHSGQLKVTFVHQFASSF